MMPKYSQRTHCRFRACFVVDFYCFDRELGPNHSKIVCKRQIGILKTRQTKQDICFIWPGLKELI